MMKRTLLRCRLIVEPFAITPVERIGHRREVGSSLGT
jgi:hypothetical protein